MKVHSIGVQHCTNRTGGCDAGSVPCDGHDIRRRGSAIFNHSAEDPRIFQPKRGWHMLVNALLGGFHPQDSQGGHTCSLDGLTWSDPRIGGYNQTITCTFPDGTSVNYRRERPQIVQDTTTGQPIGISNGMQCPRRFGVFKGEGRGYEPRG
jgi:hypothetical protein